MKATLYLQYRQAAITIDLTQHVEQVVGILKGSLFDHRDERIHRFYYMNRLMRDVLIRLRSNIDIAEMLASIETSMKKLDIDFDLDRQISDVNPSVLTIDTRSK